MKVRTFFCYFVVLFFPLLMLSCRTMNDVEPFSKSNRGQHSPVSKEEAMQMYERSLIAEETRVLKDVNLPFYIGDLAQPDWNQAVSSATKVLSSIDIPLNHNLMYQVDRIDSNGCINSVYAYSKLVAVKSLTTGESEIYVKICIPNNSTDYDNCNDYLNCEDRRHYSGLEYYTYIGGTPVAAAKYKNGEIVDHIFLGDEKISPNMRMYKLSQLMGNMWIRKIGESTRADGDFEYGDVGEIFWGTDGNLYINLDTDGDGIANAVTDLRFILGDYSTDDVAVGNGSGNANSESGNSGGSSGSAPSGPSGGGSGNGSGGSSDNGDGSTEEGGDSGAGSGTGPGSGSGEGGGNGTGGSGGSPTITIRPPLVDPIYGLPDKDLVVPEKPKSDLPNGKADPLVNMEILGTLNNGIKGGRFGNSRGRMHNGCDLKAAIGTPIFAMFDGTISNVVNSFNNETSWSDYEDVYGGSEAIRGAGNKLWIQSTLSDGSTIIIKVFHLSTVFALPGANVEAGDIIGLVGTTGSACSPSCAGPHLHIEVWKNGVPINPETFFYTQLDENGKPIE